MKSLGLTMSALMLSVGVSFAQGEQEKFTKEPFATSAIKLSHYLQLENSQMGEVAKINEYFIDMQRQGLQASARQQDKKMQQAVYSNLKLMKQVLTPEQYRKYLILLNVTNNNNDRKINLMQPEVYFTSNQL